MDKKKKEPFNFQKLYRRTGLIIYDVINIIFVSYIAVIMRTDYFNVDRVEPHFLTAISGYLPFNIVITLIIFYVFKLYDSLWAYAGERE
ncbi:MAG: polysaccharide biosynthesis protein, partial [Lachnospiraceae bacterium]|nr:polysaccharide biosynthesis protein [Lachnospiraceae bacterium]